MTELGYVMLAWLARVSFKYFRGWLHRLLMHWLVDVPDLGAPWVVHFFDPGIAESGENLIDARLSQCGRRVWGVGHTPGEKRDCFRYEGKIRRNVLYGTFQRKDRRVLAGTGSFVVKIGADSNVMAGHCAWYDSYLDEVWSSAYVWKRSQ